MPFLSKSTGEVDEDDGQQDEDGGDGGGHPDQAPVRVAILVGAINGVIAVDLRAASSRGQQGSEGEREGGGLWAAWHWGNLAYIGDQLRQANKPEDHREGVQALLVPFAGQLPATRALLSTATRLHPSLPIHGTYE